jgi:hypothetical protein
MTKLPSRLHRVLSLGPFGLHSALKYMWPFLYASANVLGQVQINVCTDPPSSCLPWLMRLFVVDCTDSESNRLLVLLVSMKFELTWHVVCRVSSVIVLVLTTLQVFLLVRPTWQLFYSRPHATRQTISLQLDEGEEVFWCFTHPEWSRWCLTLLVVALDIIYW